LGGAVVAIAVSLDLVFGDSPNRWYPVAWIGGLLNAGSRSCMHLKSDAFAAVIGTSFLLSAAAEITLDVVSHQAGTDEVLRRRGER
jgi:cobalamin biosynthesis protein CobD/CbiB